MIRHHYKSTYLKWAFPLCDSNSFSLCINLSHQKIAAPLGKIDSRELRPTRDNQAAVSVHARNLLDQG